MLTGLTGACCAVEHRRLDAVAIGYWIGHGAEAVAAESTVAPAASVEACATTSGSSSVKHAARLMHRALYSICTTTVLMRADIGGRVVKMFGRPAHQRGLLAAAFACS